MTPSDAVSLVLNRFPILLEVVDKDELSFAAPYYVYERFAAEVAEKNHDEEFFAAACRFIDDLAQSNDPLLEEVLVVSVLEKIAEDPDLAARIRAMVQQKATAWLDRVECELYGRVVPKEP